MRRPSATAVLLVLGAVAATAALFVGDAGVDVVATPLLAAVLLEPLVPLALAGLDLRGGTSGAGVLAWAGLGAGRLVTAGVGLLGGEEAVSDPSGVLALVAAVAAATAGATMVGRWQDHGGPAAAGPGPSGRLVRSLLLAGGLVVAASLLRVDVAVIGAVSVAGGVLPGPVAVASTLEVARLALLVGALAPLAWAVSRDELRHGVAAGLVLGARAVLELAADVPLVELGLPVWPVAALGAAAATLLVVTPALARQVSSSSA